jgi:negative regulator of flagellin synthesis FlgM
MKIDNTLKSLAGVQPKAKADKGKAGETAKSQGVVQDNVDLTAQANLMRSLESALADLPDTDLGKVEEVRQAIAEGRFKVDEEVVAEKLVENTMESLHHASKQA